MNPTILIHGAYSSPKSFNFLNQNLGQVWTHSYDWEDSPEELVSELKEEIAGCPHNQVNLLGHSLGGVLAMAVCTDDYISTRVGKIITLGSPLGGVEAAKYLKWIFPKAKLFATICPSGKLVSTVKSRHVKNPRLHIVTTGGSTPVLKEANDGVVTVASQLAVPGGKQIKHDVNHFEALLDYKVRKDIETFLEN